MIEIARYIINLDRSPDRWDTMIQQFHNLDINCSIQRITAVDGSLLSAKEVSSLQPPPLSSLKYPCPRNLNPSEIGCYLSHKKCWEEFLASNLEWALILEDDLVISPRAKTYITTSDWIPKNMNLIQLFIPFNNWKAKVNREYHLQREGTLYHVVKPSPVGALAYFISRKACIRAIKESDKISMPVDEFLFSPLSIFSRTYPVYRLNPAIFMHQDFKSTIADSNENRNTSIPRTILRYHPMRFFWRTKNHIDKLTAKDVTFNFT